LEEDTGDNPFEGHVPVPVPVPANSQTACDDWFRAGPLRGDRPAPRVSDGWGPGLRSINPGSWTECTCFPESLTRKMYIKKIPEIAIDLSNCPEEKSVLDKVDKRYSISGISYEKSVQKKDPGNRDSFVQLVQISRMS